MTSPPYPGARSTTPPDPRGACKRGFQFSPCMLDVGLRGSSWWAVPQPRLFRSVSSSTYVSQTGSSEFLAISDTGHFGLSGEKVFSGSTWCMGTPNTLNVATVQEGGAGNQYLLHMGKHIGPAHVARKCRHDSI